MKTCRLSILIVLLLVVAGPARAGLDQLETGLRAERSMPLRWDNVEGAPFWALGVVPVYDRDTGMHVVRLDPGQETVIRNPRGGWVRLMGDFAAGSPAVFAGSGTGLEVELAAVPGDDARSLFYFPDREEQELVRIAAGKTGPPLVFGVFLERLEEPPVPELYREAVCSPAMHHTLFLEGLPGAKSWARIEAGEPLGVDVTGPCRVLLAHRVELTGQEESRLVEYGLDWSLDTGASGKLSFTTSPETRHTRVDGKTVFCGRARSGYVDIPDGEHRLILVPGRDMLVRVLCHDPEDYLLPDLNRAQRTEPVRTCDPVEVEEQARQLFRDNTHREGGLLGSAMLRRTARARRDVPGILSRAGVQEQAMTYLRDLFPEKEGRSRTLRFLVPRLRPFEGREDLTVPHGAVQTLLGTVGSARFHGLPGTGDWAGYALPERPAPTTLRVAVVLGEEQERFRIRLGDGPEQTCLVFDGPELGRNSQGVTTAETGMAVLRHGFDEEDGGASVGALHAMLGGTPLARVGVIDLELPVGVREVFVGHGSRPDMLVALQYRAGRTFRLQEDEYLNLVGTAMEGSFQKFLSRQTGVPADLAAHWQPLADFIASRSETFGAGVPETWESGCLRPMPGDGAGVSGPQDLIRRAREKERSNNLLAALEEWAAVYRLVSGNDRVTAVRGLERVLRGLDEHFLADRLLRYEFLRGDGASSRAAGDLLLAEAKERGDVEQRLTIHCARYVRTSVPEDLAAVSELLINRGSHGLGLMAGLLVPLKQQPHEALVRAAYREKWMRTFGEQVEFLQPERRAFWSGVAAAEQGKVAEAEELFSSAGEPGQEYLMQLAVGKRIVSELTSDDPARLHKAVRLWQDLQQNSLGPVSWVGASDAVQESSGAVRLRSLSRDTTAVVHVASPAQPASLVIWGPVRVRFTARPIHAPGSEGPVDGWMAMQGASVNRQVAVTGNRPASGLEILGSGDRPGRAVTWEWTAPAGRHRVSVHGIGFDALIGVELLRPEIVSPLLPFLSDDAVGTALAGIWSVNPVRYEEECGCGIAGENLEEVRVVEGEIRTSFSATALQRFADAQTVSRRQLHRPVDWSVWESEAGAQQEVVDDPVLQAEAMVRAAESDPALVVPMETELRELAASRPDLPELGGLADRLGRSTVWEFVEPVRSGGLQPVTLSGWDPESPGLRVRRALMPCLFPDEHILFRPGRLVVDMFNTARTTLRLDFGLGDIPWLPEHPLRFGYRVGDGPVHQTVLTRSEPDRSVTLTVPSGEQAVTVIMEDNVPNLFLRVAVRDVGAGCTSFSCSPLDWSVIDERVYDMALPDMPVQVKVQGPTRVRVDELRGGLVRSSYRTVDKGWQTISLAPAQGEATGLFRVHRLVPRTDEPAPALARPRKAVTELVREPRGIIPDQARSTSVRVEDRFKLGEQEDGSWEMKLSSRQRRSVDEDRDSDAERFAQLEAVHRYRDDDLPGYWQTTLLGRVREHGGPVLGVREDLRIDPQSLPFSIRLQGSLLAQNPDADTFGVPGTGQGETEWAGLLRGTLSRNREIASTWRHVPRWTVFGRLMSMDGDEEYKADDVDQDIFSSYKQEHRHGHSIGDTLYYRPWLDTIFFGGASAGSNEDFNLFSPDNLRFRAGWRQLWGPVQTDLQLRHTRYLEDDDRAREIDRTFVDLDVLLTHWNYCRDRFQLGLSGRLDADHGEWSGGLFLSWLMSEGRDLRDFRPGEVDFRTLREERIPGNRNNQILEEPSREECPELRIPLTTLAAGLAPAQPPGEPVVSGGLESLSGSSGFLVQAGAFAVQDNARKQAARVQDLDVMVTVLPPAGKRGLYRVVVGPFALREKAEVVAQRIRYDLGGDVLIRENRGLLSGKNGEVVP